MADNNVDLASLLCSRLCHDLLSPVGAMNNGLELLADETDPEMQKRCMELLGESARSAANKLKFFRLAFGAAGGYGPSVDPNEAKAVIEPLITGSGRTTLDWQVPSEMMPKAAVKVLLNLVFVTNEALVRGGNIVVGAEGRDSEHEIVIRASGPKIVIDQSIVDTLQGKTAPDQIDSRTAAAWMVHDLAAKNGGRVQLAQPDTEQLLIGALVR